MSGKNKILKPGDTLFRVGDVSDGMCLIRKGQLKIFLDKNGTEIPLATVGAGGMIGEMSLFEKKPRSASVRALEEVEVTQISNDDFNKVLSQIPKWFVALMTTLSSRLRDTNERLQDVESKYKGQANPIEELIKTLHILQLLWYKLGVKEVKSWAIDRDVTETDLQMILNMEKAKVKAVIDAIVAGGLIQTGKNSYKKDVLVIHNRGDLERFIDFSSKIRARNNAMKFLPQEFVDIIECLCKMAKASAYDVCSIDFKSLEGEAKDKGIRTDLWSETLGMMADIDDALVVNKVGKDYQFKVQKKHIDVVFQNAKILRAMTRSEEKKQNKAA